MKTQSRFFPADGRRSAQTTLDHYLQSVRPSSLESADNEFAACEEIVRIGRLAAQRGWVPAGSGDFSIQVGSCLTLTQSGCDKSRLGINDVAVFAASNRPPATVSPEAGLHLSRYAAEPAIAAILHVHSPSAVALSQIFGGQGELCLQGWEMQKAFEGVSNHEQELLVPIFPNQQDIQTMAAVVEARFAAADRHRLTPGYLIAGHGLYAWGSDTDMAWRHLEAFDAIFQALLLTQQQGRYIFR